MGFVVRRAYFARNVRRRALLTMAGVAVATPAVAARLLLPPITAPANHERHVGKVIFTELVTPDLAAAERFYGGSLGWTFQRAAAGGTRYAEATIDDQPVGGVFQRGLSARAHRRSAWLSFFSTGDVDGTVKTAVANGGKVLFGPKTFPDRGREAVLADPAGAVFAVLESASGDPPDVLAPLGTWIWSSLVAANPDTAAAFYQKLFGYDVYPVSSGGERRGEHLILASGGFARASVAPPPPSRPDAHSHWLNFVRVADVQETVARVQTLGGRVLVTPRVERTGDTLALVADPFHAVFGLLEWPGSSDRGSRQ